MSSVRRILICESRNLSYGSSGFFLKQIRDALEEYGVEVSYFHLAEDQANLDELEKYIACSFDAVLDINSYLPLIQMEDGSCLLDHMDAPFFHYIVDHPLHLHSILNSPLRNHHVICLDEEHCSYLKQYYPMLGSCHVLPLAASLASSGKKPFEERSWQFYFPATYMPLSEYEAKLKQRNPALLRFAKEYLLAAKTGNVRSISEEMCLAYDKQESLLPSDAENIETFPSGIENTEFFSSGAGTSSLAERLFWDCRYVDRYVREVYRHQIVEKILTEGISLHVTGAYWEYYEGRGKKNLCIHDACSYAEMLEHMADSRIVLNVQPLFAHAPHDRILCGMANGAVVFSDRCSYMETHCRAGKEYLSYDIHASGAGLRKLKKLLKDSVSLQEIAEAGRRFVTEHFLWSDWCEHFVEMIDKEKGKR